MKGKTMKKILFVLITILLFTSLFAFTASCESIDTDTAESVAMTNIFEDIYNELLRHSDKILSALAFLASLVLALAYKKGLLPILKGALTKLSDSVTKLREASENASEDARKALEKAEEKLNLAEEKIASLTEKLSLFEEDAEGLKRTGVSISSIESVIGCQVDLLYQVFMSSSLPLYQKEAVGEKIAEMKRELAALAGDSKDDEE